MTAKVPMQIAAQNLEQLCNAIDEGELNDAISKIFNESRLDLAASVDRRICFLDFAQERIHTLKRVRDEFSQAAKRMEYAVERVKEGTLNIMESHKDLPYKGELGRLQVQSNSVGKISLPDIRTTETSVRNIVDPQDILKHKIDNDFYEAKTFYVLMIDKIKKALEEGKDIPWAEIEKGRHLRVYR